jgi:4-hydroxy-4-methyl-2-oxoglutarate aldolase
MKTLFRDAVRPEPALMARFTALLRHYGPACLISDALGRENVLFGPYRPVAPAKAAGPALTIQLDPDNLVDCMPVLRKVRAGDFIVVAAHGTMRTAMWGGMMSTLCKQIGVAGALIDAATRDVDEIRDLRFPVWARGVVPRASPTSVHGITEPVQVNVPVAVGGVCINPGDIVVADESGISVVPLAAADEVIVRAEAQAAKEDEVRHNVQGGMTVADILARYGHI